MPLEPANYDWTNPRKKSRRFLLSAVDSDGKTIWIADAHRGDGKRFVARSDEKLTAFLELERVTRSAMSQGRKSGGSSQPAAY
jgi:hypothetical protein